MSEGATSDSQQEGIILDSQQEAAPHPQGQAITFTSTGEILSRIYNDRWDFSGTHMVGNGKPTTLSFINAVPEYKQSIQKTMADLYELEKHKHAQAPRAGSLESTKRGLYIVAKVLGSTNWSLIDDPREWERFRKEIKNLSLGRATLDSVTSALNKLAMLHAIKRANIGTQISKLSNNKTIKQHIAVPVGMYSQVLANAILDIETYHPHRHNISRVMREAYEIRAQIERGENLMKSRPQTGSTELSMTTDAKVERARKACDTLIDHNIPNFKVTLNGEKTKSLQISCLVVTEGFSGVRLGECVSFNRDSYDEKEASDGKVISILNGETTKSNSGIPKTATWQCHSIVKDALELAQDMTEAQRDIYRSKIESEFESGKYNADRYRKSLKEIESAFIPASLSDQQDRYIISDTARTITRSMRAWDIAATSEDVAEFDLLNPSWEGELKVGGHLPSLTSHDLRRTFAVFFKRYNFGTSADIMFQYKQKNVQMADYYANNAELAAMHDVLLDADLLAIMKDEGINLGVDIYNEIYNISEHLSGGGGESIAQDKFEKAKSGQDVYMSRSEIESLLKNGTLSYVQLATGGYCTNSSCERLCDLGIFTSGKNDCSHKIITDNEAKKMGKQRDRNIKQFRGLNTGDSLRSSMLVGIKRKIEEIEVTLCAHKIEFEPFSDKIEGLIYDGQA